jgi:colicin import membrane protein
MSTVPKRSSAADTKPSFRYGYREMRIKLPNGRFRFQRVPLTLKDVLHPRFGDVHVLSDPHNEDCNYLKYGLAHRVAPDRSAVVFSDCGIFWDIPRLRHHSPDLSVIFGVKKRKDWKTFNVKIEGVRPSLIIEVTSTSTRVNDVKTKVKQYARAQVPYYVIADAVEKGQRRRLKLMGYRLEGEKFVKVPLDENGRAWLEPVNLWLSIRVDPETGGDRLVLVDPATNEEIPDYIAVSQSLAAELNARREAEEQAEAAALARASAEERALAAEQRVRELETQRKSRGRSKPS